MATRTWQPLPPPVLMRMLTVAATRLQLPVTQVAVQYGSFYLPGERAAIYAWSNAVRVLDGESVIVDLAGESLLLPARLHYAEHVRCFAVGERN